MGIGAVNLLTNVSYLTIDKLLCLIILIIPLTIKVRKLFFFISLIVTVIII